MRPAITETRQYLATGYAAHSSHFRKLGQRLLLYLLSRPGTMQEKNFAQAQIFRPERWLTAANSCPFHNAQAQGTHNRSVHIPFGNGPRICPGRSLALLEIKAAMAMICRNFAITFVGDPKQVREVFAFAMMPHGLTMRFTARP